MHSGNTFYYISKADFETWVELVGGKITIEPDWRGKSDLEVSLQVNEVKATLSARAINVKRGVFYYGQRDEWNMVRVNAWYGTAFHFFGKGARSVETASAARDLHDLLTGQESD